MAKVPAANPSAPVSRPRPQVDPVFIDMAIAIQSEKDKTNGPALSDR